MVRWYWWIQLGCVMFESRCNSYSIHFQSNYTLALRSSIKKSHKTKKFYNCYSSIWLIINLNMDNVIVELNQNLKCSDISIASNLKHYSHTDCVAGRSVQDCLFLNNKPCRLDHRLLFLIHTCLLKLPPGGSENENTKQNFYFQKGVSIVGDLKSK